MNAKVLVLLFLIAACGKPEFEVRGEPKIIGHGGMGIDQLYPLNTYESILTCVNLGADGVEIDLQLSKDSVFVLHHHRELSTSTSATGKIYELEWAFLEEAFYTDLPYTNYALANLEALWMAIGERDLIFSLDCKTFNPDSSADYIATYNRALLKLIDTYDMADKVLVELPRADIITDLQARRPDLNVFLNGDPDFVIEQAISLGVDGVVGSVTELSFEDVVFAREHNLEVAVYNTHGRDRSIMALELEVDYIQADEVRYLINLLK